MGAHGNWFHVKAVHILVLSAMSRSAFVALRVRRATDEAGQSSFIPGRFVSGSPPTTTCLSEVNRTASVALRVRSAIEAERVPSGRQVAVGELPDSARSSRTHTDPECSNLGGLN